MTRGYLFSPHANGRCIGRKITDDQIAAAFAGRCRDAGGDREIWYDPASRVAVVTNPKLRVVVTVFRLKKSQVKRMGGWV